MGILLILLSNSALNYQKKVTVQLKHLKMFLLGHKVFLYILKNIKGGFSKTSSVMCILAKSTNTVKANSSYFMI